jgi:hypothetical protein
MGETLTVEDALIMAMDFEALDVADLDDKYGRERVDKGWLDVANAALRAERARPAGPLDVTVLSNAIDAHMQARYEDYGSHQCLGDGCADDIAERYAALRQRKQSPG